MPEEGATVDTARLRQELDTSQITSWRSIVTLIVFVLTNLVVLFPFHIPIFVPRPVARAVLQTLTALRIIAPRPDPSHHASNAKRDGSVQSVTVTPFVRLRFPINFVTAPLIADLFLIAILAIGRTEVHDGTVGANNISPLDIMAFFLSLAYIAISIDASGLIRYLAFKVLQWGGAVGHKLFFYLYLFFFGLTACIGNDPVILSGTAFLAYMTRVSSNIVHPRAWIHTQFAVANIASAVLVSSNPTNLVLAGAFKIKFINYTANIIVPVVATAVVLFPFLLYIVFANESLIPLSIKMHELPEEARGKKPVNPNIPHARGNAEEEEQATAHDEPSQLLSLEEIMNPFLDKGGAWFGAALMAATLITLLVNNAVSQGEYPVFWVTLPAAFVMLCFDVIMGWRNRKETREIARKGRDEYEHARAQRAIRDEDEANEKMNPENGCITGTYHLTLMQSPVPDIELPDDSNGSTANGDYQRVKPNMSTSSSAGLGITTSSSSHSNRETNEKAHVETDEKLKRDKQARISRRIAQGRAMGPATLVSKCADAYQWAQETFPTAATVIAHLPFALVPFAFAMFVLVQALVTKGWVPVFAHGWDHWVNKTGTVGAIGGMGFLSVILCNFAGTNIGTAILLSRVIQAWQSIHILNGAPISDRTFWATIYSMALGLNYGAFSAAFSASLAGILWRDILARKHIHVHSLDFARVNLPIIAIAMTAGCAVLVGQLYVIRGTQPYDA